MNEASNDFIASPHAIKLAETADIDLSLVVGSGNDGLITKADVDRVIAKRKALSAPIQMPGASLEETLNAAEPSLAEQSTASLQMPDSPEAHPASDQEVQIELPSSEDLMRIIGQMRTELTALQDSQAELIDRDRYASDLTDDMFFLCRPEGLKWEEKRIRNKRTILVDFVSTAFFGPFEDEEKIQMYLDEKRSKREDSYIDWQNINVMTGRDARKLDAQEKHDRDLMYQDDVSTNALDRRVFVKETEHDTNMPTGQLVGPAA